MQKKSWDEDRKGGKMIATPSGQQTRRGGRRIRDNKQHENLSPLSLSRRTRSRREREREKEKKEKANK